MNRSKIFIGNLPYKIDEKTILAIFAQYGQIKKVTLSPEHRQESQSRRFAYVEYVSPESAIMAVDNFDGIFVADRKIRVKFYH